MAEEEFAEFAAMELEGWSNKEIAQSYADGFAKVADQSAAALAEQVWAGYGCKALDLCCGQGNVSAMLVAEHAKVTGLDFSPAMLELARANVPEAEFVQGDAINLPFEDQSFDAVTIGFGILHVPDPMRVLSEAHRVLQPGGRIAFSVWQAATGPSMLGYLFAAIGQSGDPSVGLPDGPGLHDFAHPDVALPALERTGFTDACQTVVRSECTLATADQPVDLFVTGTVRGNALLSRQSPKHLAAICATVRDMVVENHGAEGPWTVPLPAVITSATAG